ncbi:Conserved_hypothetical protein [Hexamita inflata]|uniref:Uncharacterized protein n=1 Tax=Hexamita inflata TaxID=28002 RepID=A0AA86V3R0_9EUKA|nr:Conserved hypothetical protein [Hexamita inflata]CAI9975236.1 Conserved hypothetical protein [Hexamita inflata]CAI9975240.1 Conserved hypothetical protein [Hexamita inflata]
MLIVCVLAGEWPKIVNSITFNHSMLSDFVQAYESVLIEHKTKVINFVTNIKGLHNDILQNTTTFCGYDSMCHQFVEITNLTDNDFTLFNAYIEAVLDQMVSFHKENNNTIFGYSLSVNSNYPNARLVYDFLIDASVEYISQQEGNKYTALSVAGFEGFFALKTETYAVGFVNDFGNVKEVPSYDESEFVQRVSKVQVTFGYQLLELVDQNKKENVLSFLQVMAYGYETNYIIAFIDFNNVSNTDFYALKHDYRRNDSYANQVQSSCRYADSKSKDDRIAKMEKRMSKLEQGCNISSFNDFLLHSPFRNKYTAIIGAYKEDTEMVFLQQCVLIIGGKEVDNCIENKNGSNTWWIILLCCLLAVFVIVAVIWVFFCIKSKQRQGYEQPDNDQYDVSA